MRIQKNTSNILINFDEHLEEYKEYLHELDEEIELHDDHTEEDNEQFEQHGELGNGNQILQSLESNLSALNKASRISILTLR